MSAAAKPAHPLGLTYLKNKVAMSLARLHYVPYFQRTVPAGDPKLPDVIVKDLPVSTPSWGTLACRSYASATTDKAITDCGLRPTLVLNFHASGFVFNSMGMDRYFLERLATALPETLVIDVDYPKAPEVRCFG